MKLSSQQLGQLQNALLSAYPTIDDLRMMVRLELDIPLDEVATGENLRVIVFKLLTWAESNGRIRELIDGAHRQNPGSPEIQKLHQDMFDWSALSDPLPETFAERGSHRNNMAPAEIDVFLTYSRADSELMHRVHGDLREAGLSVWIDEGLEAGTVDWQEAIEEAIRQARCLVVLLSPDAKDSQWVTREIALAQQLKKHIFPVLAGGDPNSAIPFSLITTQWTDVRKEYARNIDEKLIPVLLRFTRAQPMPEQRLARSGPAAQVPAPPPVSQDAGHRKRRIRLGVMLGLILLLGVSAWILADQFSRSPGAPLDTSSKSMVNQVDGAEYAFVRSGEFYMGTDPRVDSMGNEREYPGQKVMLDDYYIMRTEVTNRQFGLCVAAQVCEEPNNSDWARPELANRPVTDVTWNQADTYAKWVKGRLPTEAEWEKACRGTAGNIYPWGNKPPTAELLNYRGILNRTADVSSYPAGSYGLYDMAGNVWEWTASFYAPYPFDPVASRAPTTIDSYLVTRGAAWAGSPQAVRCATRHTESPDAHDQFIGFRVVYP